MFVFFVSVGVAYTIKNSQTQFVYDGNIYKNNCAYFYIMPEASAAPPQSFSRKVCIADFFDDDDMPVQCKQNKNYSQNDVVIAKNQQHFGHRKRIKP